MDDFNYIGKELEVFQHAKNWKLYWRRRITPYMGDSILDVGAGLGATIDVFQDANFKKWVALEPDKDMVEGLRQRQSNGTLPAWCEVFQSTIAELHPTQLFDSILYIDVLEHIEHDKLELQTASQHLNVNGYLIVLSPAFQYLYTPFDEAIGHYRRYNKQTLAATTPSNCKLISSFYLDSVGVLASLGNRLFLRSSEPNIKQIKLWDTFMVPISRYIADPVVLNSFGRSIVNVWQRSS